MKKLGLLVLPLFAAFMLLGGCGQKAAVSEESSLEKTMACVCAKDCKVCAKDMKNCGKEGCTCMKASGKTAACVCAKDCKVCAKDMKNCGKEGCTCMKMDMKGMKPGVMKDMKKDAVKGANPAKLAVRQAVKAEIGKEVVCPVTKEKFKVTAATQVIDYKGKAYFMCCNGCPDKFMATPEKYAK